MMLLVDLSDIDSTMINAVGGKALNLGIMSSGELPVPGGFCVTTDAYRLVVADQLDDLMGKLADAPDAGAVAAAAEEARRRVLAIGPPDELRTAIADRYSALGDDKPVAVRSSATAEDLAYASFAGQQDTYLNVIGSVALLDAVRRCWASLWTDRAVSYRNANGSDHRSVALAVVVQRMIDAAVAGVMFYGESDHRQPERNGHRRKSRPRGGRSLWRGQPGPLRCQLHRPQDCHTPAGRQADDDHQPAWRRHRAS